MCRIITRFVFITLILSLAVAYAEKVTKTGTTAAKFLAIGVGSRANGLGDAFVSIANDATAMYWNPAGTAQLKQMELVVNYTQWLANINFSYIGYVIPLLQYGTIGLNATYMGMGEMDVTTEEYPEGTGETFTAGSYALGISYARKLTDRFSIGANVKYIQEYIMNCNAGSVALDIGTLFITPFKDIRFGVSISNFGRKMQMTGADLLVQKDIDERIYGNNESVNAYLATDQFDLPLLLRIGLSGDIKRSNLLRLTWSVDAAHPNDNSEYLNYGVELGLLNEIVMLRAGVKSQFLDNREEKLSLGGGLNFSVGNNMKIHLDYAYQSFISLHQIHKYTLSIVF